MAIALHHLPLCEATIVTDGYMARIEEPMISVDQKPLHPSPQESTPQAQPSISALIRRTFEKWYIDNIPRHAAALAFYTLFAIAPLLLLAVEVMSLLYGRATAEEQLTAQIEQYVHNADAAALAQTILNNALPSSANWFVTIGIVISLLYGASAVFGELQIMLNIIWGVHYSQDGNFRQVIWQRLVAIIMVILSGLLIVVVLLITLWYAEATSRVQPYLQTSNGIDQLAYFGITLGLTALVFALIYKYVPDIEIAWHDVMTGAIATAFLVSIARLVITLYMSYNRIGSVYGAAGSLVILLLWVYYSSQIFFLGAEFTHVYSMLYGAQRHKTKDNKVVMPPPLVIKADAQAYGPVEVPITNVDEQGVSTTSTTSPSAKDSLPDAQTNEANQGESQRRRFGLPRIALPRKVAKVQLPTPALPDVRGRATTVQSRAKALLNFPRRLFRPIREIGMAVGVIGALSLAALFGFPWGRRKAQQNRERAAHKQAMEAMRESAGESVPEQEGPLP